MKNKVLSKRLVIAVAMACAAGGGVAEATTTSIPLAEGWNLVNTPIEPPTPTMGGMGTMSMMDTVMGG